MMTNLLALALFAVLFGNIAARIVDAIRENGTIAKAVENADGGLFGLAACLAALAAVFAKAVSL